MSGLRLATTQREFRRGSPLLLLEMLKNPDRLASAGTVTVGGVGYPAVDYKAGDQTFTVMFDPSNGLPARIRTLDYDNIWGDVTYDLVLSDWKAVDGVRVAMSRKYELNGRPVVDIKITEVKINAPIAADRLTIPAAFKAGRVEARDRRGALSVGDPAPVHRDLPRLRRAELRHEGLDRAAARGAGARRPARDRRLHHSLIVEMSDHLIVFDAPVSDWQSGTGSSTPRRQSSEQAR